MQPLKKSTECSLCGNTGWRPVRAGEPEYRPGYDISVPCEHCAQLRIERQRAELQALSRLTNSEQELRLSHITSRSRPDTQAMIKACRDMLAGQAFMLTIWGSNGNAKSAALVATVNEFLDKGVPAIYLPAYDLLNWLQDAFSRDGDIKSESAYERLERIKAVRVLAVDEFQAVKGTDWRLEQLRNLIDRRWRDGLDGRSYTLVAMNEDPSSLEPRIWSRLQDGRNRTAGSPIIRNSDSDMRPLLRRKA